MPCPYFKQAAGHQIIQHFPGMSRPYVRPLDPLRRKEGLKFIPGHPSKLFAQGTDFRFSRRHRFSRLKAVEIRPCPDQPDLSAAAGTPAGNRITHHFRIFQAGNRNGNPADAGGESKAIEMLQDSVKDWIAVGGKMHPRSPVSQAFIIELA